MAEALGISERLLKNWVRDRVIPFTKIKRVVLFDLAKVESALERFERQPR
jgi:excisionase family DNA binding protein